MVIVNYWILWYSIKSKQTEIKNRVKTKMIEIKRKNNGWRKSIGNNKRGR